MVYAQSHIYHARWLVRRRSSILVIYVFQYRYTRVQIRIDSKVRSIEHGETLIHTMVLRQLTRFV